MQNHRAQLSVFALVMLITSAIDSIRNFPAMALSEGGLIFFVCLSAIFFLIPLGLVSAELSATWPESGGVFAWGQKAFGRRMGWLAIWLQWINTVIWYPTILSFIAATIAFLFDPTLAQSRTFLVTVTLCLFWGLTLLNLFGLKLSTRFASFCALVGMILPMGLIIGCGIYWFFSNAPSHLTFEGGYFLPNLSSLSSWQSLTAIMTSFLGIELATVHVRDIHRPQRVFPKAIFYSVCLIVVTIVLGALSIAIIVPHDDIRLVDGVMQQLHRCLMQLHLTGWTPVLAVMLVLGSLGGLTNWIISPAKGLLHAGESGCLPKQLTQTNAKGVPWVILLLQAVLVSGVCLIYLLMDSVSGVYWLLTDLSTELYIMMYVILFLSAMRLRARYPHRKKVFQVPFGEWGHRMTCGFGLLGCFVTLWVGFLPPQGVNVQGTLHFTTLFSLGILILLAPAVWRACYLSKELEA